VDKAAYISEYELPMEWLRVCFENPGSAYNCGRCGKCLVARVTLRTVGALERCKTLPSELDLEEVANMDLMNNESRRGVVRQLLKVLEHLGTEPELARALKEALEKSSEASETGTEGAERQRPQQLSLAQKKLERTAPG
jgi:predicted nuclease with TOPRIM domain